MKPEDDIFTFSSETRTPINPDDMVQAKEEILVREAIRLTIESIKKPRRKRPLLR